MRTNLVLSEIFHLTSQLSLLGSQLLLELANFPTQQGDVIQNQRVPREGVEKERRS